MLKTTTEVTIIGPTVTKRQVNRHMSNINNILMNMKNMAKLGFIVFGILFITSNTFAQTENSESETQLIKSDSIEKKIFNDFDFVLGNWDFYAPDGTKIGEQTYTKREDGHLILEEWKLSSGQTGLGMTFVDPKTGLWRQVWMSPMYHIDYSGSLDENGAMVLEGILYPNNGDKSSPIRGIWTKQADGSVKQDFFVLNDKTNTWEVLFAGFTRLKQD